MWLSRSATASASVALGLLEVALSNGGPSSVGIGDTGQVDETGQSAHARHDSCVRGTSAEAVGAYTEVDARHERPELGPFFE